jgi:hypothetical protein
VSLGSISKSYGLPGLRIGWIATRDSALRDAVAVLKDYTTICASAPSEFLTALALRNRQVLLDRNLAIVRRNLPLLDRFFERHAETFAWTRPTASPIGFPRVTGMGDLGQFCARLAGTGSCFPARSMTSRIVRIGFGRADARCTRTPGGEPYRQPVTPHRAPDGGAAGYPRPGAWPAVPRHAASAPPGSPPRVSLWSLLRSEVELSARPPGRYQRPVRLRETAATRRAVDLGGLIWLNPAEGPRHAASRRRS